MTLQVELTDEVLRAAQEEARRRGTDVSHVVEECLRASLSHAVERANTESIHCHIFHGDGLQPGVDINDGRAVRDLLDSDGPARC